MTKKRRPRITKQFLEKGLLVGAPKFKIFIPFTRLREFYKESIPNFVFRMTEYIPDIWEDCPFDKETSEIIPCCMPSPKGTTFHIPSGLDDEIVIFTPRDKNGSLEKDCPRCFHAMLKLSDLELTEEELLLADL